jgi:hypothetical protein
MPCEVADTARVSQPPRKEIRPHLSILFVYEIDYKRPIRGTALESNTYCRISPDGREAIRIRSASCVEIS